jgi:hypothetical protein
MDISKDSIILTKELVSKYCQWYAEINGGKPALNTCMKTMDMEQPNNDDLVSSYD